MKINELKSEQGRDKELSNDFAVMDVQKSHCSTACP